MESNNDRHIAIQPSVARAKHLAHSARAQRGGNSILVERGAYHGRIIPVVEDA